jgi:dipeptidase
MEIIGKGSYEFGSVWVALKVPNGAVCAHANQARIQTFSLNDHENVLYASDTISFARKIGLFDASKPDDEFSFSDVYDPITFEGARYCEARVWSVFSAIMGKEWSDQYVDHALGLNITNRLPLFITPPNGQKISLSNVMEYMRSHYENTLLDMTSDVGAGHAFAPFRFRPIEWSVNGIDYVNERPIGTQQTLDAFVAQVRSESIPRELAGVLWYSIDDSSTNVHLPIFGSATKIPKSYAGQDVSNCNYVFSFDDAYYVFNIVANWAYSRWNVVYPEVHNKIIEKESKFIDDLKVIDAKALKLYHEKNPATAVEYVTDYSVKAGNQLVKEWGSFFGELFIKYKDGFVADACSYQEVGYSDTWYEKIVNETGDRYLHIDYAAKNTNNGVDVNNKALKPVSKQQILKKR